MKSNKDVLTIKDVNSLRAAGFKTSFSGITWFGADKDGHTWQVMESEDNDTLIFRQLGSLRVGSFSTMARADFNALFKALT